MVVCGIFYVEISSDTAQIYSWCCKYKLESQITETYYDWYGLYMNCDYGLNDPGGLMKIPEESNGVLDRNITHHELDPWQNV